MLTLPRPIIKVVHILFHLIPGVFSSPNPAPDAITITITASASIPSTAPQFTNTALFTSAILNSTNFFRSQHNATDVTYNHTLASFAADYLDGDADCTFAHSGGPYGENIALGCSDASGCVDLWGDEGAEYDYGDPGFSEATGHFTQLVWKDTTTVGCGSKLCGDHGWFLVCEYWPRGNVIGEFAGEVDQGTSAGSVVSRPALLVEAMAVSVVVLFGALEM
jgi:uncharacterized protein YkwD